MASIYVINGMGVYGRRLFAVLREFGISSSQIILNDPNMTTEQLAFLLSCVDDGYRMSTELNGFTFDNDYIYVDGNKFTFYNYTISELVNNHKIDGCEFFIDCTGSNTFDDLKEIAGAIKNCYIIGYGINSEGFIFSPYSQFNVSSPLTWKPNFVAPAELSACVHILDLISDFDYANLLVVNGGSNSQFIQDSTANISYPQIGQSVFGAVYDNSPKMTKLFGCFDYPNWNGKVQASRLYVPTQRGMMINVDVVLSKAEASVSWLKEHFANLVDFYCEYTEEQVVSSDVLNETGLSFIIPSSLVYWNEKHINFTVFYDNVKGYFVDFYTKFLKS